MSSFHENSIFWIEVDKIRSNPYQPRREFDEAQLKSLADSIRQYGVLQALVVTRKEMHGEDGMRVEYELVAGERRLRAATLAGVAQVPVLIRQGTEEEARSMKLELAIIENVQREDLNPVDRARAFQRLVDEFSFNHTQIAKKVGKSREYVGNSVRILSLPEDILEGLTAGKLSEGHTRPLMMLNDRPAEQSTLFKEIVYKKLTVREAEAIARKVAIHKIRRKDKYNVDPELVEIEEKLTESLGTRVSIERREKGGKLSIDFFSADDLQKLIELMSSHKASSKHEMLERYIASQEGGGETMAQSNKEETNEVKTSFEESSEDSSIEGKDQENADGGSEEVPAGPHGAEGSEIHIDEAPLKPAGASVTGSPVEDHIKQDSFVQAMQEESQADTLEYTEGPADNEENSHEETSDFNSGDEKYENELLDDRSPEEKEKSDSEDLYSVRNFTI